MDGPSRFKAATWSMEDLVNPQTSPRHMMVMALCT